MAKTLRLSILITKRTNLDKIVNQEGLEEKFYPNEFNVETTFHFTPPIIATKQANEPFTASKT